MKRAGRILLIGAACAAAVVVVAVLWARNREPEYKGKRLSEWIEICRSGDQRIFPADIRPTRNEAQEAVRQIGTNGLPFLVKWIQSENPTWKLALAPKWAKLPPRLRMASVNAWLSGRGEKELQINGMLGLTLLGEKAAVAIPELRRVASAAGNVNISRRAITALAEMGAEGQRAVIDVARNAEARKRDRQWLLFFLGNLENNQSWHAVVPVMIECLRDKDWQVRAVAADAIRRMPDNTLVPALIKGMGDPVARVRAACATSLGSFGALARPALPKLFEAQEDEDFSVRKAATYALERIDRDVREAPTNALRRIEAVR